MSRNVLRNPPSVSAPVAAYHHAAQIPAGARMLYMAGQVGYDIDGSLPDAFEEQARNTYKNILAILKDDGMGPEDLVKTTTFMVEPKDIAKLSAMRTEYLGDAAPPGTLVYVKQLAFPELLLEIEAVAAKHG